MKIIFAGGGTAGHVNPAIAAANFIRAREENAQIWFSGSRGNIEEALAQKAGYEIFTFPMAGLSRKLSPKGLAKNAVALTQTLSAISGCKKIIRRLNPDIVVGTGGYACYPMVYAASRLGVKTALLEINATPGIAIKQLASKADCVMVSYAEAEKLLPSAKRVVHTGSPVREEIFESRMKSFPAYFNNSLPMVTCFWGSAGALYMNQKMLDVMALLAKNRNFNLLYAAGKTHIDMMRSGLASRGIDIGKADNIDLREYIYDMDRALALSDLVICRAGGTLAELCAAARPSIIVPSPWVAEMHTHKNAQVLQDAGAAVVLHENETTAHEIYTKITELLADRHKLACMGQAAGRLAQPQALQKIYDTLKEISSHT